MLYLIAAIIFGNKKRSGWAVVSGIMIALWLIVLILALALNQETSTYFFFSGWLLFLISLIVDKKEPDKVIIEKHYSTHFVQTPTSSQAVPDGAADTPTQKSASSADASPEPSSGPVSASVVSILHESSDMIFQGDLPVVLQQSTIYRDDSGNLTAACSFISVVDRSVHALSVDLVCYDVWHNVIDTIHDFQYLDLDTVRDVPFGAEKIVDLPGTNTRRIDAVVIKIVFADGTLLTRADDSQYAINIEPLEKSLNDPELLGEYRSEIGDQAVYTPKMYGNHWTCTCGALNGIGEPLCHSCHVSGNDVFTKLDTAYLRSAAEERKRVQAEENARKKAVQEAENIRLAEHKKRRRKTAAIISAGVALIAVIAFIVFCKIIPAGKYKEAEALLNSGDTDAAFSAFDALGSYKDSQERAAELAYETAKKALDAGDYSAAAELFSEISSYKDSEALAAEANYQKAVSVMEQGSYTEAAEMFKSLGDLHDSKILMTESYYLYAKELYDSNQFHEAYLILDSKVNKKGLGYEDSIELANSAEYQYASGCLESGRYEDAAKAFRNIPGYKDSEALEASAYYEFGLVLMNGHSYAKAEEIFSMLGDYKDSPSILKEAKYQQALHYMSTKDYIAAADLFKSLGKYSDSSSRSKEAMYAFVLENRNNEASTTYIYLQELKKANYKDSKKIYDELYSWKITGYVNTSSKDTSTELTSITTYTKGVTFHFHLSGGTPGEKITLYEVIKWPSGGSTKQTNTHNDMKDGDTFTSQWEGYFCEDPAHYPKGTLSIKVYDAAANKLIGTVSIKVTK